MSGEHQTMVFKAEGLDSNEKLLLLAYTEYTDPHGYCWPGMTRLSLMTGLSASTIRRTRKALEGKNLLRHQRRTTAAGDSSSNLYRVNLDRLTKLAAAPREFDDNLMALEFSDTHSDQPIVQTDTTPRQPDTPPSHGDRGVPSGWNHGPSTVTPNSESDSRSDSSAPEQADGRTEPVAATEEERAVEPETGTVLSDAGGNAVPPGGDQGLTEAAEDVVQAVDLAKLAPWPSQRRQLAEAVSAALASGYTADRLTEYLRAKVIQGQTMKFVLGAFEPTRIAEEISESAARRLGVLRPVCGQCEGRDGDDIGARVVEGADGRLRKCPRCHPHATTKTAESA